MAKEIKVQLKVLSNDALKKLSGGASKKKKEGPHECQTIWTFRGPTGNGSLKGGAF